MSAVAAQATTTAEGQASVCACGFGLWSPAWPGRPRHCMACAGLNADDLPCAHIHLDRATGLCMDCYPAQAGIRLVRTRRLGELRPAAVTIGDPGACPSCNHPTRWRLAGRVWCEMCWWATESGEQLAAELGRRKEDDQP